MSELAPEAQARLESYLKDVAQALERDGVDGQRIQRARNLLTDQVTSRIAQSDGPVDVAALNEILKSLDPPDVMADPPLSANREKQKPESDEPGTPKPLERMRRPSSGRRAGAGPPPEREFALKDYDNFALDDEISDLAAYEEGPWPRIFVRIGLGLAILTPLAALATLILLPLRDGTTFDANALLSGTLFAEDNRATAGFRMALLVYIGGMLMAFACSSADTYEPVSRIGLGISSLLALLLLIGMGALAFLGFGFF